MPTCWGPGVARGVAASGQGIPVAGGPGGARPGPGSGPEPLSWSTCLWTSGCGPASRSLGVGGRAVSSGAVQDPLGVAGTGNPVTEGHKLTGAEGLSLAGIPAGEGWLLQGAYIPSAGLSHPKLFSALLLTLA